MLPSSPSRLHNLPPEAINLPPEPCPRMPFPHPPSPPPQALATLAERTQCDVRACLHTLQLLSRRTSMVESRHVAGAALAGGRRGCVLWLAVVDTLLCWLVLCCAVM